MRLPSPRWLALFPVVFGALAQPPSSHAQARRVGAMSMPLMAPGGNRAPQMMMMNPSQMMMSPSPMMMRPGAGGLNTNPYAMPGSAGYGMGQGYGIGSGSGGAGSGYGTGSGYGSAALSAGGYAGGQSSLTS